MLFRKRRALNLLCVPPFARDLNLKSEVLEIVLALALPLNTRSSGGSFSKDWRWKLLISKRVRRPCAVLTICHRVGLVGLRREKS
jgi:hypothetical protein